MVRGFAALSERRLLCRVENVRKIGGLDSLLLCSRLRDDRASSLTILAFLLAPGGLLCLVQCPVVLAHGGIAVHFV